MHRNEEILVYYNWSLFCLEQGRKRKKGMVSSILRIDTDILQFSPVQSMVRKRKDTALMWDFF